MSKNSKQARQSIRTSTQEARIVPEPESGAERALNWALGNHYRKVGAKLSDPRDGWVQYLLSHEYGPGASVERSLERLSGLAECERDVAAALVLEIWADDCEDDLWDSTFEEEMYYLEELHEIPDSQRCW